MTRARRQQAHTRRRQRHADARREKRKEARRGRKTKPAGTQQTFNFRGFPMMGELLALGEHLYRPSVPQRGHRKVA
jgi:hypothetical protein